MKRPEWTGKLKKYEGADVKKSILQLVVTVVPYLTLLGVMLWISLRGYSFWFILLLSAVACPFFVRIFIIMHDCTHNCFFTSTRACNVVGHLVGILLFTSFFNWKRSHMIHHGTVSNLDKRGTGDVWTMTVKEFHAAGCLKKISYRLMRNPVFLFLITPVFLFVVVQRFPLKESRRKERVSTHVVNLILLMIVAIFYYTVGIYHFLMMQLPVLFIASTMVVWLFFIQHQFRDVYWAHNGSVDKMSSSMDGCSFYKLPALLRWASGSIGYHHLHHLNPHVPNYKLKRCYDDVPELQEITPILLFSGFNNIFLALWDEESGTLVSFKQEEKRRKASK